jgi:hypothetical protein
MATVGIALAQQVGVDFDHQARFSEYKTYSWQAVKAPPLWDTRIKNAVDAQLVAKGWTRMDSDGDIRLVAIGITRTQRTLHTFYDSFGGGWGWRGFGGLGEAVTTEQDYKVGTLVVDMFDAGTKRLIWRGSAEDTLSDKPEKNEKKLAKAVEKMFKDFPPRPAIN